MKSTNPQKSPQPPTSISLETRRITSLKSPTTNSEVSPTRHPSSGILTSAQKIINITHTPLSTLLSAPATPRQSIRGRQLWKDDSLHVTGNRSKAVTNVLNEPTTTVEASDVSKNTTDVEEASLSHLSPTIPTTTTQLDTFITIISKLTTNQGLGNPFNIAAPSSTKDLQTNITTSPSKPAQTTKEPLNNFIMPSKTKHKKSYKQLLCEYLDNNVIINSAHYEHHLKMTNSPLHELELNLPLSQLEPLKKTKFRSNYLRSTSSLPERPPPPEYFNINHNKLVCLSFFLTRIAQQSNIDRISLIKSLGHWLYSANPKKRGLILHGISNAGKTLLLYLLQSQLKPWEMGTFQCPTSRNVCSTFIFQNLANTYLYCCNEFKFVNEFLVQSLKELFEGAFTMKTDVKHKDAITLKPAPVCITMNTKHPSEVFEWIPDEEEAFKNRALILNMDTKMKRYMSDTQITACWGAKEEMHYLISKYWEEPQTENSLHVSDLEKYIL